MFNDYSDVVAEMHGPAAARRWGCAVANIPPFKSTTKDPVGLSQTSTNVAIAAAHVGVGSVHPTCQRCAHSFSWGLARELLGLTVPHRLTARRLGTCDLHSPLPKPRTRDRRVTVVNSRSDARVTASRNRAVEQRSRRSRTFNQDGDGGGPMGGGSNASKQRGGKDEIRPGHHERAVSTPLTGSVGRAASGSFVPPDRSLGRIQWESQRQDHRPTAAWGASRKEGVIRALLGSVSFEFSFCGEG